MVPLVPLAANVKLTPVIFYIAAVSEGGAAQVWRPVQLTMGTFSGSLAVHVVAFKFVPHYVDTQLWRLTVERLSSAHCSL